MSAEDVFVKVEAVEAVDPYSARQKALQRIDLLSDLFTLFYHRSKIAWRSEALVVKLCCQNEQSIAHAPRGPMEKAFDLRPEKASKELNVFLKSFSTRKSRPSFQRFNRVADLHGICTTHDIVDNQLVNLWTAIETLVPSHAGGSKIAKVVRGLMPFIGHAYAKRILERLLFDLHNWDRWRTKKLLNRVPCDRGTAAIHRLAGLIAGKDCVDLRDDLYEKLGNFHLLRYRCFRLAEQFYSGQRVSEMLDRHERKVAWQIRRLYRARNLVVHTSRSPSYLSALVENGHEYLDSALFAVMRLSCGEYKTETIEQAFELGAVRYQTFRGILRQTAEFEASSAAVLTRVDFGRLVAHEEQQPATA